MEPSELNDLIAENSVPHYSIEHQTYLSNHLTHGIIALAKLGADKERINSYIRWYLPKLEKPEQQPDQTELPPQDGAEIDFDLLKGKRKSYFPLYEHYRKSLDSDYNGSVNDFVSYYYPRFAAGMGSALLHVGIHTGYGCAIRNPNFVAEGIAYFHHSFMPIQLSPSIEFPFGYGDTEILDVLEEIRKNDTLLKYMIKESSDPDWMPYYRGTAQKRVNVLARDKGDELASYVSKIKLPDFFNPKSAKMEDVLKLMDWVIDCSIIVYQCAELRNDFILVHGVTSAWALRQVLSCFKPTQVEEALRCIKLYIIVLFSAYLTQECPVINREYLNEKSGKSWDDVIKQALSLETDEHVYKCVQVCRDRSLKSGAEKEELYKSAAMLSMSKSFFR